MRATATLAAAALLAAAVPAIAAEFRDVAVDAAVLYDGPSDRARKRFIVVRGTPLEVISVVARWTKVRDVAGDVLWIPGAELGASHHVVVSRALASVRRTPDDVGQLLFQAERGVLLEVVDEPAPAGWLKVRYRDGTTGFVSAAEVWGH
ncbi:MAG: SH3 domain-containing protein [Gammaproteobacteria bacterium]